MSNQPATNATDQIDMARTRRRRSTGAGGDPEGVVEAGSVTLATIADQTNGDRIPPEIDHLPASGGSYTPAPARTERLSWSHGRAARS
ncbi:hypothetical protein GCM10027280_54700 [Micromonospora polyrhachis]